jgi:hypothetical protein
MCLGFGYVPRRAPLKGGSAFNAQTRQTRPFWFRATPNPSLLLQGSRSDLSNKTPRALGQETDAKGVESVLAGKSRTSLRNWQTVLKNYRETTVESTTTVAAGIETALNGFKTQFQQFTRETESGDGAFTQYLQDGLGLLSESSELTRFPAVPGQNNMKRSDVESYADSVTKFISTSKANCAVGSKFGLGKLCETDAALAASVDVAHKLLGVCDFDVTAAASNDGTAALSAFCQERDFDEVHVPAAGEPVGTVKAAEPPRSAFDALSNMDRLLTFSGAAAVELDWTIGESKIRSSDVGFEADACVDIFGGLLCLLGLLAYYPPWVGL